MTIPRNEQETIVIFDVEKGGWHIDTTYPPHVRKYIVLMGEIEVETQDRLSGWIDLEKYTASFSVKKRRELSDDQKQAMAERLRKARGL